MEAFEIPECVIRSTHKHNSGDIVIHRVGVIIHGLLNAGKFQAMLHAHTFNYMFEQTIHSGRDSLVSDNARIQMYLPDNIPSHIRHFKLTTKPSIF